MTFSPSRCPSSPTGWHKLGAIHFVDKERRQFVQACKYGCFGVRSGKIVVDDNGVPQLAFDHFSFPCDVPRETIKTEKTSEIIKTPPK